MAFLGSKMATEAGLRLLLVPLESNVVIRSACCTVGVAVPVYSTFKAIEAKDPNEQHKWLLYWAVYGSFSVGEIFADKFISWFPLYYHMKFAFLAWLQLPTTNGAKQLYMNHLRPFLLRHQARLDQIVGLFYSEAGKFVSAHQGEFEFMKTMMMKFLMSVKQLVNGSSQPLATQERRAIAGPREQVQTSVATQERRAIAGPRDEVETSDSTDENHDDENHDDNHDDDDDDDDEYVSVLASS